MLWQEQPTGNLAGPVASATNLYWSDTAAGNIWTMGLDGTNAKILAVGESQPNALAVDAKYVYWMSGEAFGE